MFTASGGPTPFSARASRRLAKTPSLQQDIARRPETLILKARRRRACRRMAARRMSPLHEPQASRPFTGRRRGMIRLGCAPLAIVIPGRLEEPNPESRDDLHRPSRVTRHKSREMPPKPAAQPLRPQARPKTALIFPLPALSAPPSSPINAPTTGALPLHGAFRRGGRVVECTALEMRHRCKPIGGSNPSLSARSPPL